jgi:hypothetical protein
MHKSAAMKTILLSAFVASLLLPSSAQVPEQRGLIRFNTTDVLRYMNEFTKVYIDYVASREKRGEFFLDANGTKAIAIRLSELIRVIEGTQDKGAVVARVGPQMRAQVQMATRCEGCGVGAADARAEALPESAEDLKRLLRGRLVEVSRIVEKEQVLSKEAVLLLERHIFYLRQIAIAYLESS